MGSRCTIELLGGFRVTVDDRPGVLGEVARKLGDAGVNITLAYLATSTRLVFAASDLGEAYAALTN